MNSYDQKSSAVPTKPGNTRQAGRDGKAPSEGVHQVTDKDVIRKPQSTLPQEEVKPPMSAAKGNDEVMSTSSKQP